MDTAIKDLNNFIASANKTVDSLNKTIKEVRENLPDDKKADFDKELSKTNWSDVKSELSKASSLLNNIPK